MSYMSELPSDILLSLLSQLDYKSIVRSRAVRLIRYSVLQLDAQPLNNSKHLSLMCSFDSPTPQ